MAAREPYGQTEAFRFYGGPIDDEDGQLNAWPLEESHVDYVVSPDNGDDTASGAHLINSPEEIRAITPLLIAEQNENGGETNVSAGWCSRRSKAIAILLY